MTDKKDVTKASPNVALIGIIIILSVAYACCYSCIYCCIYSLWYLPIPPAVFQHFKIQTVCKLVKIRLLGKLTVLKCCISYACMYI